MSAAQKEVTQSLLSAVSNFKLELLARDAGKSPAELETLYDSVRYILVFCHTSTNAVHSGTSFIRLQVYHAAGTRANEESLPSTPCMFSTRTHPVRKLSSPVLFAVFRVR